MPRGRKEIIQSVKGMRDILEKDAAYFKFIEKKSEEIASYYGFQQIITPVVEKAELFIRSELNDNPLIEKEMYTFKTKGKDYLALRPEGTPPIIRAYFENGFQSLPQPVSLWYSGTFYRHENPQQGRYREFRQFGLEVLGKEESFVDAFVIYVFYIILKELGFENFAVHLNNLGDNACRKSYRKELLAFLRKKKNYLCSNCKKRMKTNPLRFFDCKDQKCQELKTQAPQIISFLCAECKSHFKKTVEILDNLGVPYYLDPILVRGLDYYSRTVFEIFSKEGESNLALCSGGRYDYLSKMMGFKDLPGMGGAFGFERIVELIKLRSKMPAALKKKPYQIFFAQLGEEAKRKSLSMLEELRKARFNTAHGVFKDSLKAQLKIANDLQIPFAIILGQKELIDGMIMVRDMTTGAQENIPQEKMVEYFKAKFK